MKHLWRILIVTGVLVMLIGLLKLDKLNRAGIGQAIASSTFTTSAFAPNRPNGDMGTDIKVEGDLAYISGYINHDLWAQIVIFDISNPIFPKQLAMFPGNQDGYWQNTEMWADIDVVGSRLYAFEGRRTWEWQGVLHIFDVTQPSAPVEIATLEGFGFPRDVAASKDNRYLHLLATPSDLGIRLYDISDLQQPILVSTYGGGDCTPADYKLMQRYNYIVYRNDRCGGNANETSMTIYDVSDPFHPTPASNQLLEELTRNVIYFDVAGDYLYVTTNNESEGLKTKIIDITQPSHPFLAAELDSWQAGIRSSDGYLYGYNTEDQYVIFYVSDAHDLNDIKVINSYESILDRDIVLFDVWKDCIVSVRRGMINQLYTYCYKNTAVIMPTPTSTPTPTLMPLSHMYLPLIDNE